MNHSLISKTAGTLLLSGLLVGCGPGLAPSLTLSGTVATGGPHAGAVVTVIDSTGAAFPAPGEPPVTTTADGSYTITLPDGNKPPYVLSAATNDKTLISAFAEAKDATVNITSITHLIASRLSTSGDPNKLASELKANPILFDATKLSTKVAEITALIKPLTDVVGDTTNPLTGKFAANCSGHDTVLDSLSINVVPSGASSANIAVAIKQRLPDGVSPTVVTFTNATAPSASLPSVAASDLIPSCMGQLINDFLQRVNVCYALPQANRIASGGKIASDIIALECKTLFAGDNPTQYRNSGAVVSSTGSFSGIFTDTSTGHVFDRGNYEYTRGNGDLVISYRNTRASGNVTYDSLVVTWEGSPAKLKAKGDQYTYDGNVRAFQQYREFVSQPAASYYSTGFSLGANNALDAKGNSLYDRVEVTPPRGSTYVLKPSSGYSGLVLMINNNTTYTGTGAVRLRGAYADPAQTGDPAKSDAGLYWLSPSASDVEVAAYPAQSNFTFSYFLAGNTGTTPDAIQYYRMLARPLTIAELQVQPLAAVPSSDLAAMKSGTKTDSTGNKYLPTPATGPYTVNWTVPSNAWPPTTLQLFGSTTNVTSGVSRTISFNDNSSVTSISRSGTIPCAAASSADLHCSGSNFVPGSFSGLQFVAYDTFDRHFGHFYSFNTITIVP